MSKELHYAVVNVFAETSWGGNPLAIVPDADTLDSTTMQLIARQFNLSETVFICSPDQGSEHAARLRIFTPDHELPFAGHPTIGASSWLHQHLNLPDTFTLQTNAKTVTIRHNEGIYRLAISGYASQDCSFSNEHLADALHLHANDFAAPARWMNAGTWQLIVPLNSAAAVNRAQPNLAALLDPSVDAAHLNVYLCHVINNEVTSRYFFNMGQAVLEDPGTGGACCNLGAWAHESGQAPLSWHITQAASINRPNHLYLNVNAAGDIQVGGRVMPFATGQLVLP
ncbi:Trans-2,3-dihydro-3-hydroxyanthranilate isomerase [Ephemeroptericola cinctiostellae]|uniref:Trans-2,3-dihydro-3-hydroxyanthranilate isomerase n=1 Tax=Ephemeroptericola cinctiostellae TaxID=2268024 RepID=A0A345DDV2_9BURK|nr:PhzF family phenazine biosynthesis protein [Ephemeroptericola cinctiostellae]AXF86540.1 Trans-2,3-dihydro-3-hydroxyanthranilate isomerase [Ephemeroptericola cinctiostellae]